MTRGGGTNDRREKEEEERKVTLKGGEKREKGNKNKKKGSGDIRSVKSQNKSPENSSRSCLELISGRRLRIRRAS